MPAFLKLVLSLLAALWLTGSAAAQRIGPPPTSERSGGFTPLDIHAPAPAPAAATSPPAAGFARDRTDFAVAPASAEAPASSAPLGAPLPLKPRQEPAEAARPRPALPTMHGALGTVTGSLGIVLGVFLLVLVCFRRVNPPANGNVPKEAVELLGRLQLSPKQHLQLLRLGNKLVLLAVSPTAASPVAEVADPAEVEQLTALCRRGGRGAAANEFRQVLTQLASEPAAPGFLGRQAQAASARGAR